MSERGAETVVYPWLRGLRGANPPVSTRGDGSAVKRRSTLVRPTLRRAERPLKFIRSNLASRASLGVSRSLGLSVSGLFAAWSCITSGHASLPSIPSFNDPPRKIAIDTIGGPDTALCRTGAVRKWTSVLFSCTHYGLGCATADLSHHSRLSMQSHTASIGILVMHKPSRNP